ncbi:hypothetical protein [Pontibacter actiniarum]|uniref:Uncharacterized protein n=1 Tax=Pontibacter actiniarum TaxID=323450 RepID=A0A1X9YVW2_9BACT|nr:hypothetical protein [Pontibacter actiniarum]ARS36999.1 hypothetical protein CA264_17060 [Pontibacter actiniarum]
MPSYKHTQPSSENEGKPTGRGQDKAAGGKPVDPSQTRAEHEELKKKHTNGPDDAAGENTMKNNPNRNTNKPEIDNGKYN